MFYGSSVLAKITYAVKEKNVYSASEITFVWNVAQMTKVTFNNTLYTSQHIMLVKFLTWT